MKTKLINMLLVMLCLVMATACKEDDDLKKIKLTGDSKTEMNLARNQTSGEITFNAQAAWSCHLSATPSRATDDLDWITLHTISGGAGGASIPFTLEVNDTGASRTAYIVILCEDTQITIEITQTTENDGDIPAQESPLTRYHQSMESLFERFLLIEWDGNAINYNNGNLVEQIHGNLGTATLEYFANQVKLTDTNGVNWVIDVKPIGGYNPFISGLIHTLVGATHIEITHLDGDKTSYDLEYENARLVKCTEYKNGHVYETTEIEWENGDIKSVKTTYNQSTTIMTPVYSNVENSAGIMEYDTFFWVDLDDAQVLYYCGLLGFPTKHLIESYSAREYENGQTYDFTAQFQYSLDSQNRPTKIVYREIEGGVKESTSTIDYAWKNRY